MEMEDTEVPKIEIILGGRTYAAVLDDTAAARQFVSMLPLTLTMRELNGNEKYHYLANALPTDAKSPSAIHAGDLMLFGTDCLVLFYKDFPTSYRYTSLGRIEDAFGLADAAGNADVIVTFRMEGSAS